MEKRLGPVDRVEIRSEVEDDQGRKAVGEEPIRPGGVSPLLNGQEDGETPRERGDDQIA